MKGLWESCMHGVNKHYWNHWKTIYRNLNVPECILCSVHLQPQSTILKSSSLSHFITFLPTVKIMLLFYSVLSAEVFLP